MKATLLQWSAIVGLALLASSGVARAQDDDESKEGETAEEAAEPAGEAAAEGDAKKVSDDELVKGMKTNTGRGYGPAGCGLGSLIFEPNSGFTQIFAATTNGTFGSTTFGISSGTSNCNDPPGGSASAKTFVETNRTALAKDIARGQGETIESLSRLGGCADAKAVGSSLQKNFDRVFPNATMSDADVGNSVVDALRSDATLSCDQLI
jgi:DUF3015 family protein